MENDKYYKPNIEDIHVGYECEFHGMTTGGLLIIDYQDDNKSKLIKEPDMEVWYPIKCGLDIWSSDRKPEQIFELLKNNQIRTPYLTKEQIEAEGWQIKSDGEGFIPVFEKNNYFLCWYKKEKFLKIMPIDPAKEKFIHRMDLWMLYQGECKSINEFRKICKLLNIN